MSARLSGWIGHRGKSLILPASGRIVPTNRTLLRNILGIEEFQAFPRLSGIQLVASAWKFYEDRPIHFLCYVRETGFLCDLPNPQCACRSHRRVDRPKL